MYNIWHESFSEYNKKSNSIGFVCSSSRLELACIPLLVSVYFLRVPVHVVQIWLMWLLKCVWTSCSLTPPCKPPVLKMLSSVRLRASRFIISIDHYNVYFTWDFIISSLYTNNRITVLSYKGSKYGPTLLI